MHAIVVFDSLHGNTERVADVIGEALGALGEVRVVRTTDLPPDATADIWVVGGPTHGHGMSKPLVAFVDRLRGGSLRGVPVATFDTRYHYPRLMTGSAAHAAAGRIRRTGCRLVTEPASFFVKQAARPVPGEPALDGAEVLEDGELDRARAWGAQLAALLGRS